MSRDTRAGGPEAGSVQLHLHRGIGWGLYGTATAVVFLLTLVGVVSNVRDGSVGIAAAMTVGGLVVTGFLALVTQAMVVPELTVSATGVRGRLDRTKTIDAVWDEITIDVDDDPTTSIRLDIGTESVSISSRTWIGFPDLIMLVGRTADAAARLTPAARDEVIRLLQPGR